MSRVGLRESSRSKIFCSVPSKPASVLGFPGHHYNAITSWAVDAKGEIKNVYA